MSLKSSSSTGLGIAFPGVRSGIRVALASLGLLTASGVLHAQDVSLLLLAKGLKYQQSGATPPVLSGNNAYRFDGNVASHAGGVNSASLLLPGGATLIGTLNGDTFQFKGRYNSLAALNAGFPDGTYTLSVQTVHDGPRSVPLGLTGASYPNPVQVLDYPAAQGVNAGANFTVNWSVPAGGTVVDFLQVSVEDSNGNTVFQSPGLGRPGALTGGSPASFTIPDHTLAGSTSYTCRILSAHYSQVNTSSYGQGVTGYAAYYAETDLPLVTTQTPDVNQMGIAKGRTLTQSSAAAPVPDALPYTFQAFADVQNGAVTGGTLKLPGGTAQPLGLDSENPGLESVYATLAALDAAYPPGNYTLTINTVHDGVRTAPLALPASVFPGAPQVSNFAAAQDVDADAAFTLQWGAFPGGTVTDFIQVQVNTADYNTVFQTGQPGEAGALDGTATSVTIPVQTLQPGQHYIVSILFARFASAPSGYGAAFSGFFSSTSASLVTRNPSTAPDVKRLGVVKGNTYVQASAGAPVPDALPFLFEAFADGHENTVTSGSLKLPGGSIQSLGADFDLHVEFPTVAALDAAYPPGSYTVTVNTVDDGTRSITLALPSGSFPAAPQLSNFTAAQAVDPNAPFTVHWNAFPGGTANDYIEFQVRTGDDNGVFNTGQPGEAGSLDGTATSATIPGQVLQPGRSYTLQLLFARFSDRSTTYGEDFSGYFSQTLSTLVTTGIAIRPTLTLSLDGNGQWHLHATGPIGQQCVIEQAGSLTEPITWNPVFNFTGNPVPSEFTDGVVRTQSFYRVREM